MTGRADRHANPLTFFPFAFFFHAHKISTFIFVPSNLFFLSAALRVRDGSDVGQRKGAGIVKHRE